MKTKNNKKIEIKEDEKDLNINSKIINIKNKNYKILYIPETLDVISYLHNIHIENGHKGIASLRQYLKNHNIFIEGSTILTDFIVKNCVFCSGKNKAKIKKGTC